MPIGNFCWAAALLIAARALAQENVTPPRPQNAGAVLSRGDVSKGQAILEGKGGCLSCHRVADQGSHLGPDLSSIGSDRPLAQIEKALLDPSAEVRPQFQLFSITTRRGKTYTGRLLNQDRNSVQLLDTEDRLRSFDKAELATHNFVPTPPMPSYREKLSLEEQADLISYLSSLKGVVKQ